MAALKSVPQTNEEAEVRPHGISLFGPALSHATLKLPPFGFTIHSQETTLELRIPVSVVDSVPDQFGVQKIEPRKMHVDHEPLEGSSLCGVVVVPDVKTCLFHAGVERFLPSWRTRHT